MAKRCAFCDQVFEARGQLSAGERRNEHYNEAHGDLLDALLEPADEQEVSNRA